MMGKEPLFYPSRNLFLHNPGVPDRQLWAIGMVVVQWGMAEFLREQITFNIIGDDKSLTQRYEKLRHSNQRTAFWKELIESKMTEPNRTKYLAVAGRFEALNNHRDDIIHRQWGGGIQPGSLGAPDDAPITDAGLHRNRDEKMKTKSTDLRANIRRPFTFIDLRDTARKMAALNSDLLASFLPEGTGPGPHNVWAFLRNGKLIVGVSPGEPNRDPDI
jgi:hypothetical protein